MPDHLFLCFLEPMTRIPSRGGQGTSDLRVEFIRLKQKVRRPDFSVIEQIRTDRPTKLSHLPGLNWRPARYECAALPTELRWQ